MSSSSTTYRQQDQQECQRYLNRFRVTELKELLKSMGVTLRGKKPELFSRAQSLLHHGSPKLMSEIIRIYERTHAMPRKSIKMGDYASSSSRSRYPDSKPGSSSFVVKDSQSYVVHPDVKFKAHPYYQNIECLIRPTALVSTRITSHGNSMMLQFHLTPYQVQAISSSRSSQEKYGVQLMLRFARKESSCEQEDFYPKQCYVKVNGTFCTLPGYSPQMSVRPEYKRLGAPVSITELVKLSVTKTNDVTFYWANDILYPQGFCVCVDLVQSLSSSDLLQKLKQKGVRSPDISRALVREKLVIDRDSEISATSLRVSILCPLGKLRMTHPCRARVCTHLQCFDASIYLQMNERKSRWMCPVCDNPAPVESLEIDGLFKEICAESSSNDVGFLADGSWYPISSNQRMNCMSTPEKKCVRLTVEDSPPATTMDSGRGSSGEGTQSDPIVIDLTEDSDEDEEEAELCTIPISSSTHTSSTPTPVITNTSQPNSSAPAVTPSDLPISLDSMSSSSFLPSCSSSSSLSSSSASCLTSYSSSELLPFTLGPSTAHSTNNLGIATTTLPFQNFLPLRFDVSSSGHVSSDVTSTSGIASGGSSSSIASSSIGRDLQIDYGGSSVKRRCSSSADDVNCDQSSDTLRLAPISTTTTGTTAQPVPVITEYAPALPHFSAPTCIFPFLSHTDAVQTVLASSSTNTLHSGFSSLLSLEGLRQVPSFNCELVKGSHD